MALNRLSDFSQLAIPNPDGSQASGEDGILTDIAGKTFESFESHLIAFST